MRTGEIVEHDGERIRRFEEPIPDVCEFCGAPIVKHEARGRIHDDDGPITTIWWNWECSNPVTAGQHSAGPTLIA